MLELVAFLVLGIAVGVVSGLVGIGGGVLLTPALIYFFQFSQKMAQGTTLALLVPPISILGAWTYYEKGFVDLKGAVFICLGFFFGALLGAKFAVGMNPIWLRRLFGSAMLAVSLRMIFFTK